MNQAKFREQLSRYAKLAGVSLRSAHIDQLEAYLGLLVRWNVKINLTALPLNPPTDQTLRRLFLEPLVAAKCIEDSFQPCQSWFDFGSGGGSPAIPLKIVRPALRLTMVEAKTRKAAFLREVLRELGLADASVRDARFQDVAAEEAIRASADLITVRAVRADATLVLAVWALLRHRGRLLLFRGDRSAFITPPGFELVEASRLDNIGHSQLFILTKAIG